uniref:Fungal lipase-type domain-containing protein n=1 Tax=Spongospora subterranea TaxID=70186 RepID=A0A0H5R5A1_9EUKA|eukprot:CRZ09066.1 hypothetical protein [Spongospora subterranea]
MEAPVVHDPGLSQLSAHYAFAAYAIEAAVPDGFTVRVRSEAPIQNVAVEDSDLTDVAVFRGSCNSLALVGNTLGRIRIANGDFRRLLVVSFRGTERLSSDNWRTNATFVKTSLSLGSDERVHSGIRNHFRQLVEVGLLRHIIDRAGPSSTLLVTGHSLGGATAFLAAYTLSELLVGDSRIIVYTFGAPRIGNELFEQAYSFRVPSTFCVGHPLDPIRAVGCAAASSAVSWVQAATSELLNPSTMMAGLAHGLLFVAGSPWTRARVPVAAARPIIRYARYFMTGVSIGVTLRAFYLAVKFHGDYCPDFVVEVIPAELLQDGIVSINELPDESQPLHLAVDLP